MSKKFGDVLGWYLDSMGKLGLSIADQKAKQAAAAMLLPEFGGLFLSHGQVRKGQRLDRMKVREFRLRLERNGYAASTIIRYLNLGSVAIKAAFHYRDWELPNPFAEAAHGLRPAKKARELTANEERRLLIGMLQPYRDMVEVMLECGFRPGELCHLTWDRIEGNRVIFHGGRVTNEGGQKSRRQSRVGLTERALGIIRRQPLSGPFVFHRDGARIKHNALLKAWHNARKQALVPHCTPHDSRRTWGKRLRRGGTDLDAIQAQARITTQAIAETVYAALDEERAMDAITGAKVAL